MAWGFCQDQQGEVESRIEPGDIPRWGNRHSSVVADCARYYTGATAQGESVILGEFVAPAGPAFKPGVYLVRSKKDFPAIFDGGCGIVSIVYSVESAKIVSLARNGVA
jgi:hypothetical protein